MDNSKVNKLGRDLMDVWNLDKTRGNISDMAVMGHAVPTIRPSYEFLIERDGVAYSVRVEAIGEKGTLY